MYLLETGNPVAIDSRRSPIQSGDGRMPVADDDAVALLLYRCCQSASENNTAGMLAMPAS